MAQTITLEWRDRLRASICVVACPTVEAIGREPALHCVAACRATLLFLHREPCIILTTAGHPLLSCNLSGCHRLKTSPTHLHVAFCVCILGNCSVTSAAAFLWLSGAAPHLLHAAPHSLQGGCLRPAVQYSRAAACLSSMLREQDAYATGCGCGCGLCMRLTYLTLACADCRVAAVTMQMRWWTPSNACCKKVRLHS